MGFIPPYLEVRKITGGWSMFPPSLTTGDDLTIYANGTDTYPYIKMNGNADVVVMMSSAGNYINFGYGGNNKLQITVGATEQEIEVKATNGNLYLKPNGTGNVKFGTYTAGAATDSTGYITILDAAGNTRKLMVQA